MRLIIALALCALLPGCTSFEAQPAPPQPAMPSPQDVELTHEGEGSLTGQPPSPEAAWSARRRMDVDQLDASIQRVMGFPWTDSAGRNQLEELATTLGKPDFIDSTQEDLTVSLLFQKFLGDMARDLCAQRADGEADGSLEPMLLAMVEASTTVESDPAAVDANLQHLLLLFHGQNLATDSSRLEPWRWLFTSSVHVTGDPVVAWRAVCVGLLTHPDFYSY